MGIQAKKSWGIICIAVFGTLCVSAICLTFTLSSGLLGIQNLFGLNASSTMTTGERDLPSSTFIVPATSISEVTQSPQSLASLSPLTSTFTPLTTSAPTPELENVPPEIQPVVTSTPVDSLTQFALQVTSGPSPTFPPLAQDAWCIPWNAPAVQAIVLKVIDGTTIIVQLESGPQQISYSGLGLLEFTEDWRIWQKMRDANRSLVEGRTVTLIGGGPGSLSDAPMLRYVLAGGAFINLELVQSGYAVARTTPPETSCDEVFRRAEAEAIASRRGLWAPAPTPTRTSRLPTESISTTGTIVIVKIAYLGTPWQEPDEFVEILNAGTQAVQLAGWSIRDAQNHAYIFPKFVLGAGQYCRVTTDEYQPEHCGFSYYKPSPVWDNDGDCAYLQDSQGRLVDEFCY